MSRKLKRNLGRQLTAIDIISSGDLTANAIVKARANSKHLTCEDEGEKEDNGGELHDVLECGRDKDERDVLNRCSGMVG